MKKRYTISDKAEFKIYSDYYMRFQTESRILNSGAETHFSISTVIWDKSNLIRELSVLIGNEKGLYRREGDKSDEGHIAKIPFVQMQLKEIEVQFKDYQRQCVNTGYEKPTEYPVDLLKLKLKWQASFDVLTGEIEALEKAIAKFTDKEAVIADTNMLAYGLICSGCFHGIGTNRYDSDFARAVLDGQYLSMVPEGYLIIDDPRSPYNQMKVSDYHKLAKQYVKEMIEADKVKFKALQATCKAEGKPIPQQQAATARKKIDKATLPKWPDWAIPYEPEPVEEAITFPESKLSRSKK